MNIYRLKEIREDKDYKQNEIANMLNVSQAQYCRYEMGINDIPVEKLCQLAKLYNTNIDYLIGQTDIKEKLPESKIYN